MTHRLKIGTVLLITVLLTAPPGRVSAEADASLIRPERQGHSAYDGVLPDRYYDLLARCETGHNWKHSTRSYTGGLGIYRGTWRRWSNSSSAKGKTPQYQVKVADKIAFLGHTEPDGEFVWAVGPWGWGCVKNSAKLQGFICQSRHKAVQRWKRRC
jgi:hypothetical protein